MMYQSSISRHLGEEYLNHTLTGMLTLILKVWQNKPFQKLNTNSKKEDLKEIIKWRFSILEQIIIGEDIIMPLNVYCAKRFTCIV